APLGLCRQRPQRLPGNPAQWRADSPGRADPAVCRGPAQTLHRLATAVGCAPARLRPGPSRDVHPVQLRCLCGAQPPLRSATGVLCAGHEPARLPRRPQGPQDPASFRHALETLAMHDWSVCVIIPLFHAPDTITMALDSLAAQTRRPERLIVIDDGPSDG